MEVKISNEITITNPTREILEYCIRELVIPNPEYIKKERMGLWVGNTPRELELYVRNGKDVIVPVGVFRRINNLIKYYKIPCSYEMDFESNNPIDYNANIELYDYQEDAVQGMLKHGFGILQAPTGSGKTQMGIALIVRHGLKALWLTHTTDLLNQSYERAARYIDKSLLGKITGGKVHIGEGITFATVQTLEKQDLSRYKYMWDVIVVDECHRCAGTPTSYTRFYKVISSLAARHKYGLSATVHRSDGLIKTVYALLGDVMYVVPQEAVADAVMQVTVQRVDTGLMEVPAEALDTDGMLIHARFISALSRDRKRNALIESNLIKNHEHYNLILSDRLEQLHDLHEGLPAAIREQAVVIDGKMTSKKERAKREQAIEDMRSGKKHFLFASYSLAKEGLDIPRLDRLHLVTPHKDYAVIVQSVGRVARKFEGKQDPICYDYVDAVAEKAWKARRRHYKKCGCKLEEA
ncbi:MAG: DEAD/DEAH box helicase [Lachnospiraceae bacterium]